MTDEFACTVCRGPRVHVFFSILHAPISCNRLCPSLLSALSEPTATITLGVCLDCEHIYNVEHTSSLTDYSPGYENSLRGSERYRQYDQALIDFLLERHQLRGRRIIEIGCGRGEFLRTLCERGDNLGIGFDPSYSCEGRQPDDSERMVIRAKEFQAEDAALDPDFVCSRHTLEHVQDPRYFLSAIRSATKRVGVPVFFEVPNGLYTLRDDGIWDLIYEHCSYFTPNSLAQLFRETGYEPLEVTETFGGEFLAIQARTSGVTHAAGGYVGSDTLQLIESFAQRYERKINDWRQRLGMLRSAGRRVIVWGAGSKTTTFLNLFRPANISFVIDVNPRKHGKYIVGTGQQIVAPEFLRECPHDDIICMNPLYVDEISRQARSLGFTGDVACA
jgi:2-polyprenyl-3-methyl-5-hydroxy-6-metoxy-1,4-benzoquinol methylase